ncbi:MAG: family 20 glycosylhydrolase [Oscillospiraceae bacterium]|nr:family 20 glycosylhydrolase [Oscillospiraceae bacterium]
MQTAPIIPRVGQYTLCEGAAFKVPARLACYGVAQGGAWEVFCLRMRALVGVTASLCDKHADSLLCVTQGGAALSVGAYSISVCETQITGTYSNAESLHSLFTSLFALFFAARDSRAIAACRIEDAPQYCHRGLMIDTARHYFSIAELERVAEQMSLCKLNVLHWHLTDDQAWRFESKAYPRLTDEGAFYTQEEIRDFVVFCAKRGITIQPEIEVPGHSTACLRAYPALTCAGEAPEKAPAMGITSVILCAGKAETIRFLQTILDELCALFPGETIHLGGDEAPKTAWEACPHCAKKREEQGLRDCEEQQAWLTNTLADYLKAKGRRVICWNESAKAANLHSEIALQYWMEMEPESYCLPQLLGERHAVYSAVNANYFDYPPCLVPLRATYGYVPEVRGQSMADAIGTQGIEAAIWTERVETGETLEKAIFPRVQALSEAAWSGGGDFADFIRRLQDYLPLLEAVGVAYTPLAEAQLTDEARIECAAAFLTQFFGAIAASGAKAADMPAPPMALLQMMVGMFFPPALAPQVTERLRALLPQMQ